MAQNEFTDFEVQVDLSNVQEWGGEQRPAVPPGEYTFRAVAVEQKTAKSSGNSMIAVTWEVIDEGDQQGAKVFNNYVLTQNALGRLKQLMIAVGGTLDGKVRASEIMGAEIRATVINEEVAGVPNADGVPGPTKTFARIQNEQPASQPEPQQQQKAAPPVTRGQQPANGAARNGASRRA